MSQEKAKAILAAASQALQRSGLETERLRLRLFREEDFPDFCAYILQKEQQRLSGNEEIDTAEEARSSLTGCCTRSIRPSTLPSC